MYAIEINYNINIQAKGKGFPVFDEAELVVGICCEGIGSYSNKKVCQGEG